MVAVAVVVRVNGFVETTAKVDCFLGKKRGENEANKEGNSDRRGREECKEEGSRQKHRKRLKKKTAKGKANINCNARRRNFFEGIVRKKRAIPGYSAGDERERRELALEHSGNSEHYGNLVHEHYHCIRASAVILSPLSLFLSFFFALFFLLSLTAQTTPRAKPQENTNL